MKKSATPVSLAEEILDRVDQWPWPVVVLLRSRRTGSVGIECYRQEDPAIDRLLKTNSPSVQYLLVGTYKRGAAHTDVVGDLLETMGRMG